MPRPASTSSATLSPDAALAPFMVDTDARSLSFDLIRTLGQPELVALAESLSISGSAGVRRPELVQQVLRAADEFCDLMLVQGCLDVHEDGFGFLRFAEHSYLPGPYDVYVSPSQIRRFNMRKGDLVEGKVRPPRDSERFYALTEVGTVGGQDPDEASRRPLFDNLVPLYPHEQLKLEHADSGISPRVLDLFCPIGLGQRALIVAPPRTGKTMLMQSIANSITTNYPDVLLMVLLVDERPEEVTDMQRSVRGEVVSSTFDEPAEKHVAVAEMVLEKAKRQVELGNDVVILLDSITRLARAYNTIVPPSGKILSGGVDSNALHKPKRFYGSARSIENGGSLTIIATALIDTGSRMDEVIFEEFKGTGNSELHLERRLAEKRIFPAIDLQRSGTRKEELLLEPTALARIHLLRQHFLTPLNAIDAMTLVADWLNKSKDNHEFLHSMNS